MKNDDQAPRRTLLIIAVLSFAASAAVDIFYFPRGLQFPDEQRIMASAVGLAQRGVFEAVGDRAWEMPGAALFVSGFVRLFGAPETAVLPVRLVQAALLALQSFLIGITAWRIFRMRYAVLIAATITAFYPFFLFYQGLLLSETLFTTLLVAGLAALYWWRDRGYRLDRALLIGCICLAAATMTKATLTVLTPFLVAVLPLAERKLATSLRAFVAASFVYAVLMTPWWIRNYAIFGTFVPFTTSGSSNLYLGNNPKNPHAGIDWNADVDQAVTARIRAIPNEVERSRAYSALAWEYIRADPGAFVDRTGRKFLRFWNVMPNAAEFSGWFYRAISAGTFTPILLLGVVCAVAWRRRSALFAPFYLLFGYFTLLHIVTIASLRYRLPIEPLLIVMAAGPLAAAMMWCEGRLSAFFIDREQTECREPTE